MARADTDGTTRHGIAAGRLRRCAILLAGMIAFPAGSASASGNGDSPQSITVASWGGAYERAQRQALFEPFTEATGIRVEVAQYNGGLGELRAQQGNGAADWDVADMTMSDNLAACEEGLLLELEHDELPPAPDGTPARRDFLPGALPRCGVTHTVYATVIAYDRRAFPGIRPTRVADLFDTERFPGKRALQRAPFGNLEWALRSYGVPRADVYNLLSTARGMRLALERLSEISGQVIWWEMGETPPDLLANGKVVMATGFNGRFFHAMASEGAPIEILWDGQIQEHETWAIPRSSRYPEAARRFVRYATTTSALARFARHVAYGPARQSASARVSTHVDTGIDMQPHLPTHPINDRLAIVKDVRWYARTHDRIRELFQEWLAGHGGQRTPESLAARP